MTTSQEFREFGVAMVNYIADYLDNIRDRPVVPKVRRIIQLLNDFLLRSPPVTSHTFSQPQLHRNRSTGKILWRTLKRF